MNLTKNIPQIYRSAFFFLLPCVKIQLVSVKIVVGARHALLLPSDMEIYWKPTAYDMLNGPPLTPKGFYRFLPVYISAWEAGRDRIVIGHESDRNRREPFSMSYAVHIQVVCRCEETYKSTNVSFSLLKEGKELEELRIIWYLCVKD